MRNDIKKVICERERSGPRDYLIGPDYDKRHKSARDMQNGEDEYPDLEDLPKQESMTARFGWDGMRDFSDRLGAIKGLVRKAEGKSWDKVYSQLCRQVSPTGTTTEQHVHQHLSQYICTKTRFDENGDVECLNWRGGTYVYPHQLSEDYYVHPKTRLVVKVKRRNGARGQKKRKAQHKARKQAESDAVFRYTSGDLVQLHKFKGTWCAVWLEPKYFRTEYYTAYDGTSRSRWVEDINPRKLDSMIPYRQPPGNWGRDERGKPREFVVVKLKAMNRTELKQHKLKNDPQE